MDSPGLISLAPDFVWFAFTESDAPGFVWLHFAESDTAVTEVSRLVVSRLMAR